MDVGGCVAWSSQLEVRRVVYCVARTNVTINVTGESNWYKHMERSSWLSPSLFVFLLRHIICLYQDYVSHLQCLSIPSPLISATHPALSLCHYCLYLGVVWSGFLLVCVVHLVLFGFVRNRETACALWTLWLWHFLNIKRGCKMTWHLNHIYEPIS